MSMRRFDHFRRPDGRGAAWYPNAHQQRGEGRIVLHLDGFTDYGLLFLRVMAGAVYVDSGYNDLKDPDARSKSIGMPKGFVMFLAVAELAGGAAVMLGVLQQFAAIGLMLIMLGAIQKKVFVWKTGFWGKDGLGWSYDLTLVSMLLVILFTNGGRFVILPSV